MPTPARPWSKDWTQYLCPGPTRRFTPEELARGGQQPWPRALDHYTLVNAALMALLVFISPLPWASKASVALLSLSLGLLAAGGGRLLWQQPSRLRLNLLGQGSALGFVLYALALDELALPRLERQVLVLVAALLFVMIVMGWFALALWRSQQIEGRLRDLDALEAQRRLMNRLATAQIHPHFVFNTLASLTHWVETQDPRAAPLLQRFSAYLRATLPMFERESQPLRDELQLVRDYLAIMEARIGAARLQVEITHEARLDALPVPPGSLLTLVENAVTHGIEPALAGGRIRLATTLQSGLACLSVSDSGEGLAADYRPGLGLSNTRERLLALHPQARLLLTPLQPQGCEARMEIPQA